MTGRVAVTGVTGLLGRAVMRRGLAERLGTGRVRVLVRAGSRFGDGDGDGDGIGIGIGDGDGDDRDGDGDGDGIGIGDGDGDGGDGDGDGGGARRTIRVVRGDLADDDALNELLDGCDAVLHLAAAMGDVTAAQLHETNVAGTRRLLAAAARAGVRRFVFTSSVAAARPEHGPYSRSKADGERLVLDAPLHGVVLRLPLLYGPGSQVERAVLGLGQRLPLVPVVRGELLRPLHVDDAAAACVEAVVGDCAAGTISLAGPDALSFARFASRLLRARGLHGRALGLPAPLFLVAAGAMERLGRGGVSVESIRAAAAGTPPATGPVAGFDWTARSLADGLVP